MKRSVLRLLPVVAAASAVMAVAKSVALVSALASPVSPALAQAPVRPEPPKLDMPKLDMPRGNNHGGATVELLKVLLRMTSERHAVASKVIATVDDLEQIAADDNADVGALHGWRRELFGEAALALKKGRLALAIDKGRVVRVEREQT